MLNTTSNLKVRIDWSIDWLSSLMSPVACAFCNTWYLCCSMPAPNHFLFRPLKVSAACTSGHLTENFLTWQINNYNISSQSGKPEHVTALNISTPRLLVTISLQFQLSVSDVQSMYSSHVLIYWTCVYPTSTALSTRCVYFSPGFSQKTSSCSLCPLMLLSGYRNHIIMVGVTEFFLCIPLSNSKPKNYTKVLQWIPLLGKNPT